MRIEFSSLYIQAFNDNDEYSKNVIKQKIIVINTVLIYSKNYDLKLFMLLFIFTIKHFIIF